MNRKQRRRHKPRDPFSASKIRALQHQVENTGRPGIIHGLTDACRDCAATAAFILLPGGPRHRRDLSRPRMPGSVGHCPMVTGAPVMTGQGRQRAVKDGDRYPEVALIAEIFGGGLPRLPGALCVGRHELFDSPLPANRIEAAALCARCPELLPCRRWARAASKRRRPAGTVAARWYPRPHAKIDTNERNCRV